MSSPRTLFEIGGGQPSVAQWGHSILLLIDAQMEYVSGRVPLAGMEAAIEECLTLLTLARKRNAPVIHVAHHGKPGAALFDPQGPSVSLIERLRPALHETLVIKSLPNAFARTNLDEIIRATGRSQLVIGGFATHMCVSSTTRATLDCGYATTVVAGACATRDLPRPGGGTIPAVAIHETALAELADRFAKVVPSAAAWALGGHAIPPLTLRPITHADMEAIKAWPPYPASLADLNYAFLEDGWLAEYGGKPQTRCEAVLDGEEVIGFTIVAKTGTDDAEYRIALRADRLGQGLGTIITRMTLERAFPQMGLARIHLIVRKNNPGARRLYEKIGFAEKGERVLEIRGNSVPFIEMDLHPQALAGTARGECL